VKQRLPMRFSSAEAPDGPGEHQGTSKAIIACFYYKNIKYIHIVKSLYPQDKLSKNYQKDFEKFKKTLL
jgi:hypothetical protein